MKVSLRYPIGNPYVDGVELDLVGVAEVAEMLNVTTTRVNQLVRAPQSGFPAAVAELKAGRIWRREEVERWARKTGRLP